jgi:hypothetical protein
MNLVEENVGTPAILGRALLRALNFAPVKSVEVRDGARERSRASKTKDWCVSSLQVLPIINATSKNDAHIPT